MVTTSATSQSYKAMWVECSLNTIYDNGLQLDHSTLGKDTHFYVLPFIHLLSIMSMMETKYVTYGNNWNHGLSSVRNAPRLKLRDNVCM